MQSIFSAEVTSLRFACLSGAIIIYALVGSPTPDAPGLAEAMIAVLLLLAAGIPGFYNAFRPGAMNPLWVSAGSVLLLYGFSVSISAGVMTGHDANHMLRDIVPFLFLLLPLFTHDIFLCRPEYFKFLIIAVLFAGILFAVRGLPEILGWWVPHLYKGELHYFANAPSILFAALFLTGFGGLFFISRFSWQAALVCFLCIMLAALPLAAIALTLQRASIGIFAGGVSFFVALGFCRYPYRMLILLVLAALALSPFLHFAEQVQAVLLQKTGQVGLNMRSEEFNAAWREISGSPLTALFGAGWGGTFESPAVGGVRVNYTHSLISAMLLKTGLCGLAIACTYLAGLASTLTGSFRRNPVFTIAVAAPMLIDIILYASYKSLDFGLILLLAAAASPVVQVASRPRLLYSNLYSRMSYE